MAPKLPLPVDVFDGYVALSNLGKQ